MIAREWYTWGCASSLRTGLKKVALNIDFFSFRDRVTECARRSDESVRDNGPSAARLSAIASWTARTGASSNGAISFGLTEASP